MQFRFRIPSWPVLVTSVVFVVATIVTRDRWLPAAQSWLQTALAGKVAMKSQDEHDRDTANIGADAHDSHDDAGSEHGHDEGNSLELSKQAQGNLGLTAESLRPIALETFLRTITVPGIVIERPGRTRLAFLLRGGLRRFLLRLRFDLPRCAGLHRHPVRAGQ